MSRLNLSVDEVLTTTRAVRKRLDFDRPVDFSVIRECLELAVQSPTGSVGQFWHFIMVDDPDKRAALGALYKKAWPIYAEQPFSIFNLHANDSEMKPIAARAGASAEYLGGEHAPRAVAHGGADRRALRRVPTADLSGAGRVRLDPAGRVELHAGRAGARARHLLDHRCT